MRGVGELMSIAVLTIVGLVVAAWSRLGAKPCLDVMQVPQEAAACAVPTASTFVLVTGSAIGFVLGLAAVVVLRRQRS